ncbi:transmembrane amino acid transporter protein-domain-containing protein [Mycena amicta]|nr:transmembrane amino acid transporter protein-domain-containing protein [Mycena amicta]
MVSESSRFVRTCCNNLTVSEDGHARAARLIDEEAAIDNPASSAAGQSTFGQTLFNCLAMLIGIGLLSVPLAFALSGWVAATILILSYAYISCYTAKVLGRLILDDAKMHCYTDVAKKAFGVWSSPILGLLFCFELFAVSVLLVTLYADSLYSILPQFSPNTYKLASLVIILPTVFLPLSILSYSSILGIISTILIIGVVLYDGLTKHSAPGSLWSPAQTSLEFRSWKGLGIAFGLFIAGFGCHPLIPSLVRDMKEPHRFERMINISFGIATFIYALVATAGYLMFGNSVSGEISLDLLRTPGYSDLVNYLALWMLVLSPLSKFALTTQPLTATLEILLGIDRRQETDTQKKKTPENAKRILRLFQKTSVVCLSIMVSILVPGFASVLAFLGCSSAFLLCVIGPLVANAAIRRSCVVFDATIVLLSLGMASWGTVAIFL